MKNPVFDASTYTKYLKERSNVKLYNSDRDTKVPQGERSSIISRPPVQDKGTNGLLAIFSKEVKRLLIFLFAGNGSTGTPTYGQLAVSSPLANPRSVIINPINPNQIIIGCTNSNSVVGGNLILSVNKSTGVLTKFAGTGYVTDNNSMSGDAIVSAAVGNGTHVTYTTTSAHGFANGASVRVIGLSLAELNITGNVFDSSGTTFRLAAPGVNVSHSGGVNGTAGIKAVDANLAAPNGTLFDSVGNFYWSEGGAYVIRRIDTDGYISRYAGTGSGTLGDGNHRLNTAVKFSGVRGMAIDQQNNIYLADTEGAVRVRRIDYATGIITTIVGTGTRGVPTEGQLGTAALLRAPTSLAFDKDYQNLYILDYSSADNSSNLNGVYRYNIADGRIYIIHQSLNRIGQFSNPRAIALDSYDNIYVGEGNVTARVFRIDISTRAISLYAGGGSSTEYNKIDSKDAAMVTIFGMFFDADNTMYVTSSGGSSFPALNRVLTIPYTPVTSIEI